MKLNRLTALSISLFSVLSDVKLASAMTYTCITFGLFYFSAGMFFHSILTGASPVTTELFMRVDVITTTPKRFLFWVAACTIPRHQVYHYWLFLVLFLQYRLLHYGVDELVLACTFISIFRARNAAAAR